MDRLLFRCIDALVDSSPVDRQAFNQAFIECGLDWHWDEACYRRLKCIAGERYRIAWYAENIQRQPIPCWHADQIHWKKQRVLERLLKNEIASPRPGVLRLLSEAATAQIQTLLTIPPTAPQRILFHAIQHFDSLSTLTVAHGTSSRDRTASNSIVVDTATDSISPFGSDHPRCITVSSNVSGAQACITHFGDPKIPAIQLSGESVLRQGSATVQSLLTLESCHSVS